MNKPKKHSIYNLSEIFDYLGLKTDKGKKHQMEKQMQKDPFLADAVEGLSDVDQKRVKGDTDKINQKIRSREKRLSKPLLFAAASVAILIIAGASYIIVQRTFTDHQSDLLTIEQTPPEKDSSKLHEDTQESESERTINDEKQPAEESVAETDAQFAQSESKKESPAPSSSEKQIDSDLAIVEDYDIEEDLSIIEAETLVFQEQNTATAIGLEENTALTESIQATSDKSLIARESRFAGAAAPSMIAPESVADEQMMKGIVIDKTNSEPIAGATIRLEGTNQVAISGINGEFSISQPDKRENFYTAQFIGMKTEEFSPTGLNYQVIAIDQEVASLEEVVVTHQRSNRLQSGNRRTQTDGNQIEKQTFKPEPVVGFENYQKYLDENAWMDSQIEIHHQPVIVKFELNNQGHPINIQTINTTNNLLEQKAINIIADGPLWTIPDNPSEFNTEPVFIAIEFEHKD